MSISSIMLIHAPLACLNAKVIKLYLCTQVVYLCVWLSNQGKSTWGLFWHLVGGRGGSGGDGGNARREGRLARPGMQLAAGAASQEWATAPPQPLHLRQLLRRGIFQNRQVALWSCESSAQSARLIHALSLALGRVSCEDTTLFDRTAFSSSSHRVAIRARALDIRLIKEGYDCLQANGP
jgi:hypothetical protein